jgi:hypothetical protein
MTQLYDGLTSGAEAARPGRAETRVAAVLTLTFEVRL